MTPLPSKARRQEVVMENINFGIACDVDKCKYNHDGCNCTLDKIRVGCPHEGGGCTCCKSYCSK